jgi:hypothetical protein
MSPKPKELVNSGDHHEVDVAYRLKSELVEEVLRLFGTVNLQVTGNSMLPSVWPGDILIIQRREVEHVAVGDILLCRQKARLFAHRVVTKCSSPAQFGIGVRGDAHSGQEELVFRSEILGTVSRVVRGGKYVLPPSRLKFHQRLFGLLTWHSDLFARLAVFVHSACSTGRWREVR